MLFFYTDELKNNKSYLINEVNTLIENFKNIQSELSSKHNVLLICMDNISKIIDNIQDTKDIKDTNILFTVLDKIKESFDSINFMVEKYKDFLNLLNSISSLLEGDLFEDSVFSLIDKFNKYYDENIEQIRKNNSVFYDFMVFYTSNCNFNFELATASNEYKLENTDEKDVEVTEDTTVNEKKSNLSSNISSIQLHDNNVLLISEKDNLVYIPYKVDEIKEIFDKNNKKYKDFQDVINQNYIIPLDRFKNPIIARFREAFSLMRKREKASISKALDLALELSFNSLLNPAVICACKNLKELNIYLDYLETNELDKFKIFDVKYEVPPQVVG